MNKSQLIEALAARYEGNRKAAREALENVLDTITREVAKGEKVAITGFGSFEKRIRPARTVRNPRTGEKIKAKKTAVPKFNPGADLKAVVSGAKKLQKLTLTTATGTARAAAGTAKAAAGRGAAKSAPAKTTATKSTAAKKSAPAKKTATKSTAAKKSAPAKKTATKSAPAKKSTAKKSTPAKKTATKSAPAKKSTAKKSTAKKSTAKKTA